MKLKLITAICCSMLCTHLFADTTTTQTISTTSEQAMPQDSTLKNKQIGDAFLKANKTKPGVVTLADGLQYKIIKEGTGPKPKPTDTVTVQYRGTLVNGTEFDNSAKHGGPISFPVNQVISGWVEALQLMPVGSTWEVFIPSDLAYGDQGAPPLIGPGSTLVFTISLIDIKK